MKAMHILRLPALVGILIAGSIAAHAETLSWTAVTAYEDGSAVTTPVTYTAIWSRSPDLGQATALASSVSTTSATFNSAAAGMPKGATVYFAVKATAGGRDSAYSAPLAWNHPNRSPSSPRNFRFK
jgi:hypothetical protein